MQTYEFLSSEWFEAVRKIRSDYWETHSGRPSYTVNISVTDVPSLNGGTAEYHLDVRSPMFYEPGHLETPDLTVVTDYEAAKTIYQDSSWGLGSIQDARDSGHLTATGDLDKARDFWIEVLHDSDHVEVFDRIMETTA